MGSVPPEFNPPRQQSGNKIWLWLLLAVGMLCVLCAIGGYFMFRSVMGLGGGMMGCAMNGDLARNAVLAYALDHNGQFPAAETWQDDVRPYYERLYNKLIEEPGYKEVSGMMDIDLAEPGTPLDCNFGGKQKSGFSYNSLLAGKLKADFPDNTIVIFETTSPAYNQSGDPEKRSGETPKMFGDKRPWMDFMVSGQSDFGDSNNAEMDFDTRPEDGLPPEKQGTTTGGANPTGA
jgi:hypothetical protein